MEDLSATEVKDGAAAVLVVDDSRLSATKLAKTVATLGHDVETAFDGASAVNLVRQRSYDAVFLDIVMPGMDGFEVLTILKADEATRDIPVIVVSSLEDEVDSVASALDLGAEDFLPKSYDLTILKARLNATLQKKRLRDRELSYLQDVGELVRAAEIIEAGDFRPSDLEIARVASRPDELGRLGKVLGTMTEVIYERERANELRLRTLWGTIMVLVAGCLFSSAPALGRLGAGVGIGPLDFVIWGNLVGVVFCLAVTTLRSGFPRYRLSHLGFCLAWALIYGCGYNFWLVIVAERVEATTIAMIAGARTFMVFALAALIALEKPSMRRLSGLAVGLLAVGVVLLAEGAFQGGESTIWLMGALALPLLLSAHTLLMAWRPKDLDAFSATALMLGIAAILLGMVASVTGSPVTPIAMDREKIAIVLGFGLATSLAVALALDIVARAGAVFASQIAYVQIFAGIAWGMLLLDERMPLLAWGAVILVLLGFLLVRPKEAGEEFSISLPLESSKRRG
ncbi:MAG: response regulator [Silicimonas sp.]|nr:response regulator [Silicimonas sp.]